MASTGTKMTIDGSTHTHKIHCLESELHIYKLLHGCGLTLVADKACQIMSHTFSPEKKEALCSRCFCYHCAELLRSATKALPKPSVNKKGWEIRQRGSHQHPRLETTEATSCQTSVHLSPTDREIIGKAFQLLLQAFCERDGRCTCSIMLLMFLRVTTMSQVRGHVTPPWRVKNHSEINTPVCAYVRVLHEHVRPQFLETSWLNSLYLVTRVVLWTWVPVHMWIEALIQICGNNWKPWPSLTFAFAKWRYSLHFTYYWLENTILYYRKMKINM